MFDTDHTQKAIHRDYQGVAADDNLLYEDRVSHIRLPFEIPILNLEMRIRLFLDSLRGKNGKYKRYLGSPLRYPGGKSLAVGEIIEFLPKLKSSMKGVRTSCA